MSISLPNNLRQTIERHVQQRDMTFSAMILQAVRGYLLKYELDRLNNEVRPGFERLGIHSDDDVQKYLEGLKKKYSNA